MHTNRNALDVAWAAGLFEGEGYLGAYSQAPKRGKVSITLGIGSTDRDVIERFRDIMGFGTIKLRPPGTNGHKPLHVWTIHEAAKVREVIALFTPYFGVRRNAKAREVLEAGASVMPANAVKTHCRRGHELTEANTRTETFKNKTASGEWRYGTARRCLICRRRAERERMRRVLGVESANYRVSP